MHGVWYNRYTDLHAEHHVLIYILAQFVTHAITMVLQSITNQPFSTFHHNTTTKSNKSNTPLSKKWRKPFNQLSAQLNQLLHKSKSNSTATTYTPATTATLIQPSIHSSHNSSNNKDISSSLYTPIREDDGTVWQINIGDKTPRLSSYHTPTPSQLFTATDGYMFTPVNHNKLHNNSRQSAVCSTNHNLLYDDTPSSAVITPLPLSTNLHSDITPTNNPAINSILLSNTKLPLQSIDETTTQPLHSNTILLGDPSSSDDRTDSPFSSSPLHISIKTPISALKSPLRGNSNNRQRRRVSFGGSTTLNSSNSDHKISHNASTSNAPSYSTIDTPKAELPYQLAAVADRQVLYAELQQYKQLCESLQLQCSTLTGAVDELQQQHHPTDNTTEYQQQIDTLTQQVNTIDSLHQQHLHRLEQSHQNMLDSTVVNYTKQINQLQHTINTNNDTISTQSIQITQLTDELHQLRLVQSNQSQQHYELQSTYNTLHKDHQHTKQLLQQQHSTELTKLHQKDQYIDKLLTKLSAYEANTQSHQYELQQCYQQITTLKHTIDTLQLNKQQFAQQINELKYDFDQLVQNKPDTVQPLDNTQQINTLQSTINSKNDIIEYLHEYVRKLKLELQHVHTQLIDAQHTSTSNIDGIDNELHDINSAPLSPIPHYTAAATDIHHRNHNNSNLPILHTKQLNILKSPLHQQSLADIFSMLDDRDLINAKLDKLSARVDLVQQQTQHTNIVNKPTITRQHTLPNKLMKSGIYDTQSSARRHTYNHQNQNNVVISRQSSKLRSQAQSVRQSLDTESIGSNTKQKQRWI